MGNMGSGSQKPLRNFLATGLADKLSLNNLLALVAGKDKSNTHWEKYILTKFLKKIILCKTKIPTVSSRVSECWIIRNDRTLTVHVCDCIASSFCWNICWNLEKSDTQRTYDFQVFKLLWYIFILYATILHQDDSRQASIVWAHSNHTSHFDLLQFPLPAAHIIPLDNFTSTFMIHKFKSKHYIWERTCDICLCVCGGMCMLVHCMWVHKCKGMGAHMGIQWGVSPLVAL